MSFFVSFVVVFIGFCKTRQPVYYLAYPTLNRLSPLFSYFTIVFVVGLLLCALVHGCCSLLTQTKNPKKMC